MHNGDMGAWAWWMMGVMAVVWIVVPALIAWAIWAAGQTRRKADPPLNLLKQTYTKGQITHDQFERAKKELA